MFTYHSVNFTYSYTRGHAKYLTLARKLSSRFFYAFFESIFIIVKSCQSEIVILLPNLNYTIYNL